MIRNWIILFALLVSSVTSAIAEVWPHPIPCRIQDGTNADLFVITLGDVQTPITDGIFDPVKDEVTLKDNSARKNYFRDTLGVKFYQPLDKSRFPLPPSGWCSWYYYYNRPNAIEIKRNADWIAANLKDFGAQIVQIDDGWQGAGGRDGQRDWTHVSTNFPNGMADVAKHIKSLGLTPGLWLAPHGQSNPAFVTNHENLWLRRTDGSLDFNQQRWEGRYLLDPSTPESLNYFREMFRGFTKWGYDYFKIDGQPPIIEEYKQKQKLLRNPSDTDELYRKTLLAIRDAIGPDRYLLGCWGIPLEGAGLMNGSRTGGDVVLGWGGFHVALRPTLQYYYLHNIVWYSDPDVLLVRSPLTPDQARVWATIYGLTGQAMMASDRLMDLSDDRVELMRRVFPAVDARPLDLFPSEKMKRIWDLKVNHLGRNYDVVGLFNFDSPKSEPIRLAWSELGIPNDKPVHVFDFWNQEYLGAWDQSIVANLAPMSCRVLTLLPDNGKIQLISTSRHITQGWVDLTEVKSKSETVFTGISKLVKNDPYELRFAFPRGTNFIIKSAVARAGMRKMPVSIFNHQSWAAVRFTSPKTQEVKWEVQFAPTGSYNFPQNQPTLGVYAERVGLDGVNLHWREQYYLNAGYQVYLDGALLGYTPEAMFPIRGLNPLSNYTATIATVWDDGKTSAQTNRFKIDLSSLTPKELSLTQIEPLRSTGQWRGFEIDEMLPGGPMTLGGNKFENGLSAFANSEAEFDLKGLYDEFTALAGLDSSAGNSATAEFVILGDGKELWRSEMKKSDDAKAIKLNISGVHKLVLRTKPPEANNRSRTQIVWAEPKVSRQTQ